MTEQEMMARIAELEKLVQQQIPAQSMEALKSKKR
jgi:hypothetical protein